MERNTSASDGNEYNPDLKAGDQNTHPNENESSLKVEEQPIGKDQPVADETETNIEKQNQNGHLVVQGETLWSISRLYDSSVADIKKWNQLTSNEVNIGEYLIIIKEAPESNGQPEEGQYSFSDAVTDESSNVWHTVAEGQTLYAISMEHKTSVAKLRELNNLTVAEGISPGQKLIVQKADVETTDDHSKKESNTHTVKVGETLYTISRKYGVSVPGLRHWNGLSDNNLEIGQILKLDP